MKKFTRVILAILVLTLAVDTVAPAMQARADDEIFVNNNNGTVKITYKAEKDETILILVDVPIENITAGSNEKNRYYYKLSEGENVVNIPMTRSTGDYKLRICKMLDNGKASVLKSTTVTLDKDADKKVFDVANMVVDYQTDDKFIKKAKSLTKSCKTESAKVKKIYDYIVQNYAYDYELLEIKAATSYYNPSNIDTYERQLGICYDISSLFAAMLRSVDVEARVVTGHTPNVKEYHAWTQVYDSKKKSWYTIDATYDMCLYSKGSTKKYTMVKKDSDYCDIVYIY